MIPKTLLFFESKKIMRKCMYTIRTWLIENGYTWAQAADTVVEYHATQKMIKARMYNELKKHDSEIRILCGTEAIATGLNVIDIARVIHVGMVRDGNINCLLQRLGRGGRKGQQVLGVFFVETEWIGERSEKLGSGQISVPASDDMELELACNDGQQNTSDVETEVFHPKKKSKADRLAELPDALYDFCNNETLCLRNILLDHYQESRRFR
jgi:superfamily II DNA helicase RecQ